MSGDLLRVCDIHAGYGSVTVLRDVTITVGPNEIVAIIGPNGAGKSSLLKTIAGLVRTSRGSLEFCGRDLEGVSVEKRVRQGISLVPEGRRLFGKLTVEENLRLGSFIRGRSQRAVTAEARALVDELFPVLSTRSRQLAGTLSGGEQQMLAIGRSLMASPSLLLLDEPSMGLAPLVVGQILDALDRLKAAGVAVLIVEQEAMRVLRHADRAYVIASGRVRMEGSAEELLAEPDMKTIYLGGESA